MQSGADPPSSGGYVVVVRCPIVPAFDYFCLVVRTIGRCNSVR